ncbi:D-alanyl-D-alanine carboxypeptidase/D-alanyl-D-alanine-endopeptidase (penicillin-binding protein 4) [Mucilaginibacter yixingensis]|uniref:D-alanyl-D-alanine carboxypeptidase/D-alanyl-D-alanine-endopeptidase (Penicillin-binding protein 4) n=1 Tax=Mucilaginibacter yixingensis TaxID=1295612 RepID=A0A2T5JCR5_9SPHI|nr:D-alanyl-D-alanine carboxypeptidase [Mucilaginibacter yixingensis]PTQ99567.1 D-alanyl-D-alanine carboxypeptidase/D-alanyl-D-alanine-endopeptidase (penicillin-binding protein 4) [Mucilaginibacter yixingensis]
MKINSLLILFVTSLIISAPAKAQHIRKRRVKKLFRHSEMMNGHFAGFVLYDLDKQRVVYEQNADKYFTPASNTKLFTFYTCLRMLGDSVPALQYVTRGDSLIFWGTGSPGTLHRELKGTRALDVLKSATRHLYFSSGRYQNNILGAGWAWDDYNDYYQTEINELPLYGNTVKLYNDDGRLAASPAYFNPLLKTDSTSQSVGFRVKRDLLSNAFVYPSKPVPAGYEQDVPLQTSTALTLILLQDTLKRSIGLVHLPVPTDVKTVYDLNADTVYRHMLQPSDNFIAEQLLLVCSATKFGVMNKDSVINYAINNLLADLPDKPIWLDGSGLSRYNLMTPRSILQLLLKIRQQVNNDELLHSLMPIGGVVGTIKKAYQTDNGQPFVWAKTGTVSNNYNQSGYLITRKGKHLAFSFMNNNFPQPAAKVREEVVRIMTYIHNEF